MKKKSLEQLALKKRTISKFSNSVNGGQQRSSYPPTTGPRPTPTVTFPLTITLAGCEGPTMTREEDGQMQL